MRIIDILAFLSAMAFCTTVWAQDAGHGAHRGGSGNASIDESFCVKAKISRYNPEHLAAVAPGAEFSFAVSGSNGPGHIHVTIRQHPVAVEVEDKDTFYMVKGHLPADIKNEMVRVSIKVKSKYPKCDAEGGILLKVAE